MQGYAYAQVSLGGVVAGCVAGACGLGWQVSLCQAPTGGGGHYTLALNVLSVRLSAQLSLKHTGRTGCPRYCAWIATGAPFAGMLARGT